MYRLFYFLSVLLGVGICLYTGAAWYAPAVIAFGLSLLFPVWRRGGFYFALLAAGLAWGGYAGYLHVASGGRLADRLAVAFSVGTGYGLVALTAVWGAVTAAFGGWFGASVRLAVLRKGPVG